MMRRLALCLISETAKQLPQGFAQRTTLAPLHCLFAS
jgi:hypothetical protein